MPIVDVEVVTDDQLPTDLAQRLADALGDLFNAPSRTTWVRLRALARSRYAENGRADDGVHPVFVTVRKFRRPADDQIDRELAVLVDRVAELCDRPRENVHVLYEHDAAARIAFGGKLRR